MQNSTIGLDLKEIALHVIEIVVQIINKDTRAKRGVWSSCSFRPIQVLRSWSRSLFLRKRFTFEDRIAGEWTRQVQHNSILQNILGNRRKKTNFDSTLKDKQLEEQTEKLLVLRGDGLFICYHVSLGGFFNVYFTKRCCRSDDWLCSCAMLASQNFFLKLVGCLQVIEE